jgi:RHS repeat-associated protein
VGAGSYTYDLAGNITGDGSKTYTWDAAGRLSTVKVGSTTVGTYTYDYLSRRAKKVAGVTTTHYVYGPNGLLYGEYSSTGTLVRKYVYLNDAPLAQIATGSPEVLTYLHTDHLGTPRYATNTAGATVWTWPSDAFGISAPTGTVTVNLRMPGQYFDSESGNFYNWNRYYNQNIGRYISPDPIGQEGGLNLFSYVGQTPIMASDPMGLDTIYINYDYYNVSTPIGKLPLGHGAVVAINPTTGATRYFEFGRYGNNNGVVRQQSIPNVIIGSNGLPTPESLKKLYNFLSLNYGQGGKVNPTYYEDYDYQGTINFAEKFRKNHPDYNLFNNNCKTFGQNAATFCKEGATCE